MAFTPASRGNSRRRRRRGSRSTGLTPSSTFLQVRCARHVISVSRNALFELRDASDSWTVLDCIDCVSSMGTLRLPRGNALRQAPAAAVPSQYATDPSFTTDLYSGAAYLPTSRSSRPGSLTRRAPPWAGRSPR